MPADHYLAFALRRDERRIPAALFRAYFAGARRISWPPIGAAAGSKGARELQEAVRGLLFAQTLPVPTGSDAVWDTRSGLVGVAGLAPR